MNTYNLYWLNGKKETVVGPSITKAMTEAGYSNGALRALDFYTENVNYEYKWENNVWVKQK